jgi:4-hydroxy-L-threonine phosphate dehydrogenase PdxA
VLCSTSNAASNDALSGRLRAIVTAPVNKEAVGWGLSRSDGLPRRSSRRKTVRDGFFRSNLQSRASYDSHAVTDAARQIVDRALRRLIRFCSRSAAGITNCDSRNQSACGEGGMFGREDIRYFDACS